MVLVISWAQEEDRELNEKVICRLRWIFSCFCRTMEERYMVACETVNSRAVLSLGIACFQWRNSPTAEPSPFLSRTSQPPPYNCHNSENAPSSNENCDSADPSITSSVSVAARVFNIWLMSQKAYTIDPLSAQFLLQHGFDFNKQVAKGIPYSPGPMGVCM